MRSTITLSIIYNRAAFEDHKDILTAICKKLPGDSPVAADLVSRLDPYSIPFTFDASPYLVDTLMFSDVVVPMQACRKILRHLSKAFFARFKVDPLLAYVITAKPRHTRVRDDPKTTITILTQIKSLQTVAHIIQTIDNANFDNDERGLIEDSSSDSCSSVSTNNSDSD